MSDNDRPTFSIDGKPYVSAGVLIYTVRYPTIYFLMQKVDDPRWNKYDTLSWEWEDMGGKSDKADQTIQDVAFRECQEETNGVITRSQLVEFTKDARSFEYCVHESKYMLHVLYVDPVKLDEWGVELFGTVEQHTGIQRTIQWTTYANLQIYYNTGILHPRLAPVVSSLILHISERQKGHYPSALKPKKTVPYKK
jgi:8-oxo-dGTP pyrophosphatase MutT (NUDIX family)